MLLIKNANIYAPQKIGVKDILIANGKIQAIEDKIEDHLMFSNIWDAKGKILTPGFIDQHVHIIGAGGKHGFHSMTPEIKMTSVVKCGSTTVVGLLGTDGSSRSRKTLNAKAKALTREGLSAYMYTGYYGLDPVHLTESVKEINKTKLKIAEKELAEAKEGKIAVVKSAYDIAC